MGKYRGLFISMHLLCIDFMGYLSFYYTYSIIITMLNIVREKVIIYENEF